MMNRITKKDKFFFVLSAIVVIVATINHFDSQDSDESERAEPIETISLQHSDEVRESNKIRLLRIPLVVGKNNPTLDFDLFSIEPLELSIPGNPPWEDNDIDAKLDMRVEIDYNTYMLHLFHFYYEDEELEKKYNCPVALEKYTFALEVEGENVQIVIDETRFNEDFDLDRYNSATIGDLTITFGSSKQNNDIESDIEKDNSLNDYTTYEITLTEGDKERAFTFNSLEQYVREEFVIDWQGYRIVVSEDYVDMLTMRVEW